MPIIIPEPYEPTDRDYEISLIMGEIESAAKGTRAVTLYDLAVSILDEIDNARASAENEAEWLASLPTETDIERLSAAEEARLADARRSYATRRRAVATKLAKPRMRVRATTGRAA